VFAPLYFTGRCNRQIVSISIDMMWHHKFKVCFFYKQVKGAHIFWSHPSLWVTKTSIRAVWHIPFFRPLTNYGDQIWWRPKWF
jgi:hypothetical protein